MVPSNDDSLITPGHVRSFYSSASSQDQEHDHDQEHEFQLITNHSGRINASQLRDTFPR